MHEFWGSMPLATPGVILVRMGTTANNIANMDLIGSAKFLDIQNNLGFDATKGTQHVIITRADNGNFTVYMSGIAIFSGINNAALTSNLFVAWNWYGNYYLDNIKIDDEKQLKLHLY